MKKFLTFLALACLMVTGAWAQAYQLGSKVTDLANLSAEKLYAIHSTNNEGYWCYNSTINQNYVGITGVKTDGSGVVGNAAANTAYHAAFQPGNVNNQWKITNEDGTYYLYNVGAEQYVTRTERDYLFTTEKTALDAIHANANGSFAIHAGGGYSGGSTNFACIVTNNTPQAVRNWTSTDHGSMLEFFEIEEISQLQETLNALIATVEEAYAANNEAIWGTNLITTNSQFSSNATEPNEGSTDNLLDGNLSTFWHSQWSGDYSSKLPHYLQVALNEPISGTVQMTMGRRQGAANDHPMKMSVQYSADGTSYTQADGYMEFSGTTGYVHGTFTLPTDAQYLRFYADETDKNRGYWHCSEFQLKSLFKQAANDQHPTEAAALQNALATAKAVTSATQTDIDNLQAALNTYKAAVDPVKTTITWELYDGTTLVDSESKADCEKDREYTTTLTVPYGYLIEGTKTVTATDADQTIKLNRVADPAFPFQYADSKENIQHWYALNIHHNNKHYVYYSADATPNVQANVTTYQTAPEYAWGFVGNPADGFVIYNKASDTTLYSADNNTSCTVGSNASTFKATLTGWTAAQADGGFCLNVEDQKYVNFQDNQLKHWQNNDSGSTFHAIELDMSVDAAYKAAKAAAEAALAGAANMAIYAADDITTATNNINAITYNTTDEASINAAIATLNGYMDTFYATANGKKFALVSKNDWSTRGVTRYLATSNNTTDRLTGAEEKGLFSVFTATYDAANKGYKVAMAYTPTIYLPVTGNASSAIVPSETPGYYTFVGGASATDPATISCISSTVSNSQGGIHLDGDKNIVVWGPSGEASKWAFEIVSDTEYNALVEAYESAQKTYTFVLTDTDGNEYEGTFTSDVENARPACVEGFTLTDEAWEDGSDYDFDYIYTATIAFPFPVNKPTMIYDTFAQNFKNFQLKSTGTGITVQKNVTGTDETFQFTIAPAFDGELFTFTIADAAGNKVYTEATSRSHDAGVVTLGETGTPFVWASGAFKLIDQNLYLSVNSSNVDEATVQHLGVWDSAHNGTKMAFEVYEPVTSLDITIGETGYATFYDNVTRTIPEGVNAYYCALNEETGNLDAFKINLDYIPRDCGVVLELQEGYNPGTYTFEKSDVVIDWLNPNNDEEIEIGMTDELWGYAEDTSRETAMQEMGMYGFDLIYVLSKVNGQLGFYKYEGETLGAHKAFYATYSEISDEINGFSLDFGGQTVGVNTVISATNLKAGFDIQGRRINKMQKGINILNGKKIIK